MCFDVSGCSLYSIIICVSLNIVVLSVLYDNASMLVCLDCVTCFSESGKFVCFNMNKNMFILERNRK